MPGSLPRSFWRDLVTGAESLTAAVKAMAGELRLDAGQLPFSVAGLADHAPVYYATLLWNAFTRRRGSRMTAIISHDKMAWRTSPRLIGWGRPSGSQYSAPRTSAGASGLGSNVECWGGPPIRNKTMHDLARPKEEIPGEGVFAVAAVRSRSARLNPAPSIPNPPMRITSRRFQPSQRRTPGPIRRSIAASLRRRSEE